MFLTMVETIEEKIKFYTIAYGNRKPNDFLDLLEQKGIKTIIDVRLRPDRAHLGSYKKAKDPDKGIQSLLSKANIAYISLIELGNIFIDYNDWQDRYRKYLNRIGDIFIQDVTEKLISYQEPHCLMCCEKKISNCHRKIIADYLVEQGHTVEHIE